MKEKLKQKLNDWIDSAQLQADFYKEKGLVSSEASLLATKTAYMNVIKLIDSLEKECEIKTK